MKKIFERNNDENKILLIGFPPIALRLAANGEVEFVWDVLDETESTLVHHNFCAHKLEPTAEVVVIETEDVGSAPCALQTKISKERVSKGVFKYGVVVSKPYTPGPDWRSPPVGPCLVK